MADIEDSPAEGRVLKLRASFVLVKTLISLCLSCLSIFVITKGDFTSHDCSSSEDLSLCRFQWVCFGLSTIFTLPLLSESLLLNRVFFEVITNGHLTSEAEAELFQYYIGLGRKYFGSCLNISKERVEGGSMEGVARIQKAFDTMKKMTLLQKAAHHLKALLGLFFVIPLIFVWRLIYRSIQTLLYLPRLYDSTIRSELGRAWTNLVLLPMVILNDPVCVILIFPLSYSVIFSSDS